MAWFWPAAAVPALARPVIFGEMISDPTPGKAGPGIDGVKKVAMERGIVPLDPAASTLMYATTEGAATDLFMELADAGGEEPLMPVPGRSGRAAKTILSSIHCRNPAH